MNSDEEKYFELMAQELEQAKIQNLQLKNQNGQMSSFHTGQDTNLVAYQLELKEELDRIYHMLSGHELKKVGKDVVWAEPEDDRNKIFSDYGVKQIMKAISFYINRNTLLSHYDEETIIWKVKDFGMELTDLIFCKYENFFYYPTPEELFEKLKDHRGKQTEDELYNKCIKWSSEELQSRLRHFPMIIKCITDAVHSTYRRALKGEERGSLRKQTMVSQNASPTIQNPTPARSILKPTTW